jgi:hypothetical protein
MLGVVPANSQPKAPTESQFISSTVTIKMFGRAKLFSTPDVTEDWKSMTTKIIADDNSRLNLIAEKFP